MSSGSLVRLLNHVWRPENGQHCIGREMVEEKCGMAWLISEKVSRGTKRWFREISVSNGTRLHYIRLKSIQIRFTSEPFHEMGTKEMRSENMSNDMGTREAFKTVRTHCPMAFWSPNGKWQLLLIYTRSRSKV